MTAPTSVLLAATVHTLTDAGPIHGAAVVLEGGRILSVVPRTQAPTGVPVTDLGGSCIIPGLHDAHSHPIHGSTMVSAVDLSAAADIAQVQAALADRAAVAGPGEWIVAQGLLPDALGADPHHSLIDAACEDHPAFCLFADAHGAYVNALALEAAQIDGPRDLPAPSEIVVTAEGSPTGILKEDALFLVDSLRPMAPLRKRAEDLHTVLGMMADSGLASAHVMGLMPDSLDVLEEAERLADLPLRLRVSPVLEPDMTPEDWDGLIALQGRGGRRWSVHGVKAFLDGAIDHGTAWLSTPDADGASTASGWADLERYVRAVAHLDAAGVGVAVHAIGDAAAAWAVHAVEALGPDRRAMPRIEHLEYAEPELIARIAAAGITVSMQPTHGTDFVAADGSDNWSRRMGPDRAAHAWPTGDVVAAGAALALGSDWPVAGFVPLDVLAAACTRRPTGRADADPLLPAQALTRVHALEAYTRGGALADGLDDEGLIAPGAKADLTVLSGDPLDPATPVTALEPVATVVAGRLRMRSA